MDAATIGKPLFTAKILLILLLHLLFGSGAGRVDGLRIKRLSVPESVENGSSVLLTCDFDLQGETLYSVRWYKNYVEFYRFLPSDVPTPAHSSHLTGAIVDVARSNSTHVLLKHTDLESEGMYTCEVSTEAPSYSTLRAEDIMQVYVLPEEKVQIRGLLIGTRVDVGDHLNLTCVSAPSKPAAVLTWTIDGRPADGNQVTQYPVENLANGLAVRRLGLDVEASQQLFRSSTAASVLRLRCTSHVLLMHEMHALRTLTSSSSARLPAANASDAPLFRLTQDTAGGYRSRKWPVISGGRSGYRVGDWLLLNCSTTSAHDVHLRWLLNDRNVGPAWTKEYYDDGRRRKTLQLKLAIGKELARLVTDVSLRCVSTVRHVVRQYESSLMIRTHDRLAVQQSQSVSSSSHLTAVPSLMRLCLLCLAPAFHLKSLPLISR